MERGDGPASVDMVDEGWIEGGFLWVLEFVVTGRCISHEEVS